MQNFGQQTQTTAALLYDLQQTLLQIKTCNDVKGPNTKETIDNISSHGLAQLHYALFALESSQQELQFTSVSAAAALYDVRQELLPLAKAYGATINFEASAHLDPVYCNKTSLKGSIYSLVAGVISGSAKNSRANITVTVQQTKPNMQRVGIYSANTKLSTEFTQANKSPKVMRMVKPTKSSSSGLGFTVANLLAQRNKVQYELFTHKDQSGVGFYVPQSLQMQIV